MLCLMSELDNDIITKVSLVLGVFSVILGAVSLIFAIWALVKAYNDSKDADIMFKHIAMSQEFLMQKTVQLPPVPQNVIDENKDSICFEKLSNFKSSNIDAICKELEKLSVKRRLLEGIKDFLNDKKRTEYETNFYSKAGTHDEEGTPGSSNAELIRIIHKLIDYGIYVSYRV